MDISCSPHSHQSPKGSVVKSTVTIPLGANKAPSRKKTPPRSLVWDHDARAVQSCWIALTYFADRGHERSCQAKDYVEGICWENTSAPILGARASLEIWCTQSQPAQPQLVPGDYSAMGSDLLHTFPVGFLCSVSLQTNKKPGLQLTGLPAWKTLTIFPACLSLELLIPVSLGTNKCQRLATLRVVLNLKRMGCRMKEKKKKIVID